MYIYIYIWPLNKEFFVEFNLSSSKLYPDARFYSTLITSLEESKSFIICSVNKSSFLTQVDRIRTKHKFFNFFWAFKQQQKVASLKP